MCPFRIVLADDHQILREGLKVLLNKQPDMEVVSEVGDGIEAIRVCEEIVPDVVVMDVMMPRMNGVDAAKRIIGGNLPTRVVALSMYANENIISEMLKIGASAFLLKDCAFDELALAVRSSLKGDLYIGPGARKILSDVFLESILHRNPAQEENALSLREIEVLRMLAEGLTNKEVADQLHLSVNTVACHRQNIMRKLNLKNAVELTKYAIRKGYIPL